MRLNETYWLIVGGGVVVAVWQLMKWVCVEEIDGSNSFYESVCKNRQSTWQGIHDGERRKGRLRERSCDLSAGAECWRIG